MRLSPKVLSLCCAIVVLIVVATTPANACVDYYADYSLDPATQEVSAWGYVEDYYDEGSCYSDAYMTWGYWEHSYEVVVEVTTPTRYFSDYDSSDDVAFGGGYASASVWASTKGDPGWYTIEIWVRIECTVGGPFVEEGGSVQEYQPPAVCQIDFTLPTTFQISTTPAMPSITATITTLDPSNSTVSWTADITHTAPSGCVGDYIFSAQNTGTSASQFSPNFQGFYGGDLTITAVCNAPTGYADGSRQREADVTGLNPSTGAIGSELGAASTPFDSGDLCRIARQESSLQQFSSGLPLYSSSGAAGLMQICWYRTNEHLWDWTENIAYGKVILNDSKNIAKSYLDSVANLHSASYDDQKWREESFKKYNAGSSEVYWGWDDVEDDWTIIDSGGDPNYVSGVLGQSGVCQ